MRQRVRLMVLVMAGLAASASAVRADDAKPQPPAFFRELLSAVPPSITHLASTARGGRVFLFYDEGSMFPPELSSGAALGRNSYRMVWTGAAWEERRPFEHVSEVLNVGDEFWALTNGGYLISKDGLSWSPLNPRPDWKEPFGCVVAGRPHVFSIDGGSLRETVFDGTRWSGPRLIPGDWKRRAPEFPFGSGPQAAVVGGRVHLFALEGNRQGSHLLDMDADGAGAKAPRDLGPADSFRLLETPEGLHLFYKDMTPPRISTPSAASVFSMMFEMQSRMARTSHRVYDGRAWSEPESILTGQAMALSAARTDDAVWLFASAMSVIEQTTRRDGRWSPLKAVPGTMTMTPARSAPLFLRMMGVWLIFAVPMTAMFGLFIWGVSSVIESNNGVELEISGEKVRCATLLRRAAAQMVDGLALGGMEMAIALALPMAGFDSTTTMTQFADHFFAAWSTMMLTMLGLYFGYFTVCEALWGKTAGKRLLGIRVVAEDGSPCSWRSAALRNALRLFDAMPCYLLGASAFAFGKKHQRVGDMAARTLVVLDAKPS